MPASLVLLNGKFITMNAAAPLARAVAVDGSRIVAVGSDDDVRPLIGPETRVIDLAGRAAMPGLIDAHAHLDREGLKEALPSMAGLRSVADVTARVAELAAKAAPGEWIVTMPLGDPPEFEVSAQSFAEGRYPNRADLDHAAPYNPVYIKSAWGYWRVSLPLVSVANTRALEAAGITRATQPPARSVTIERDASGDPTGVFLENNRVPIVEHTLMAAAPAFDLATRTQALPRSMQIYNSLGTTSVFEGHGVSDDVREAYRRVKEAGRQTVRATLALSPAWGRSRDDTAELVRGWAQWLARSGSGDEWLRMNGLYAEVDTSAEQAIRKSVFPRTGWAGFNDAGLPREAVLALLTECARNGVRVVGLQGYMLELFAEASRSAPIESQRWVFGHITALTGGDIALIRNLGLVVTTHTNAYIYRSGATLRDSIGRARENDIVPLRRLIDAGVPVALATDNVPPSLWHPIWQVVARQDRTRGEIVAPAQALTREEALRCATVNGAYLTFEEQTKGALETGKLADVVVLSQDPLTCDLAALRDTVADLTMVGGQVAFDRARQPSGY